MSSSYSVNLDQMEKYLKEIFTLQDNLTLKDSRIALLEFELALEKQMMAAFKKYYLQSFITVN